MTLFVIDYLKKSEVEYYEAFPLSRISYIGIGGEARLLVIPNTKDKFIDIISTLVDYKIKYRVVGAMTNILAADDGFDGVVVSTKRIATYCAAENVIYAECGAKFSTLIRYCSSISLGGCESLYGIPGTLGGMVYMNAGAYGNTVSDFIIDAEIYDTSDKAVKRLTCEELLFGYRESRLSKAGGLLLSARLALKPMSTDEILQKMNAVISRRHATQPYSERSLGSTFKRHGNIPLSMLIDRLGFKGYSVGGAKVSEKHAGFIINKGNATSSDVRALIENIKKELIRVYGINPELEIEYL